MIIETKTDIHYAMGESKGGESRFSPFGASAGFARAQHQFRLPWYTLWDKTKEGAGKGEVSDN